MLVADPFLQQRRHHVPGVDVDDDERAERQAILLGQFPTNQLDDVVDLRFAPFQVGVNGLRP